LEFSRAFRNNIQQHIDRRSPKLESVTNHRVTASWKVSDWEKDALSKPPGMIESEELRWGPEGDESP